MDIKRLLDEEIEIEIKRLTTLQAGGEEHTTAVESLTKLYKLRIEETKNELESGRRESDEQQLTEQVKERYFKLGIEIAGIVLPLVFYAVWMGKGFKFEENGTFTSTTFRGLFNRFKPTQK